MKDPKNKDAKPEKEKIGEPTEGGEELDDSKIIVDLCAADHHEMEGWMNAIKDFHNCDITIGASQKVSAILKPPSTT